MLRDRWILLVLAASLLLVFAVGSGEPTCSPVQPGSEVCLTAADCEGLCSSEWACLEAECVCAQFACTSDADCEHGDPCEEGVCDFLAGLCVFGTKDCADTNPCTDDSCNPITGACHHSDIDCDDGDPATYDFCIPWGEDTPHCLNDRLCKEDGDLCTLPTPNACVPQQKNCDDGDPCTTDVCDPATGDCVNTPGGC